VLWARCSRSRHRWWRRRSPPAIRTEAARIAGDLADGYATLLVDGDEVTLTPDMVEVVETPQTGWAIASEGSTSFALDTELTRDLQVEGVARELARAINDQRKAAGLELTDRIEIVLAVTPEELDEELALVGVTLGALGGVRPRWDPTHGCLVVAGVRGPSGAALAAVGADANTIGQTVLSRRPDPSPVLLAHESAHVRQTERLGPFLLPVYVWLAARHGYRDHPLERAAREAARDAVGKGLAVGTGGPGPERS
jgi:hypothetical protein